MNKVYFWIIVVAFASGVLFTIFGQPWHFVIGDRWIYLPTSWLIPAEIREVVRADQPGDLKDAFAMAAVSARMFDNAKAAVMGVALPLMGSMVFFLGVMKWADKSGLMQIIAKLLRPLMVLLFPSVPANHPAMSAMIMNISANALGLGNAATPFGIKAMEELDKLNPEKGTATNAMALFLAINTGAICLIPTTVIASRAGLGSAEPAAIIVTTFVGSCFATVGAVLTCKIAERFSPEPTGAAAAQVSSAEDDSYPLWVSLLAIASVLPLVVAALVLGPVFSMWIVPSIIFGFAVYAHRKGVPLYEAFIEGAKEGVDTTFRIIPYLVAILGAVGLLRGSGAVAVFSWLVGPLTRPFGLPAEAIPMVLLRPLSGSGANGVMMSIMEEHGPDTYIGYLVSTLQGSSETTFYVLAVYFGAIGVKRYRHTIIPGLSADLFGAIGAIIAVQVYFRMNGMAF